MTPAETLAKVHPLRPEQQQRLDAARAWLRGEGLLPAWFDPNENRRQGRTTVIAVAALFEALAHPGREVRVTDHAAGQVAAARINRLCLVPELDRILKAYMAADGPGWWNMRVDHAGPRAGKVTVSFCALQMREVGQA